MLWHAGLGRGRLGEREREREMEEKCVSELSVPLPHIDLFRSSCVAKFNMVECLPLKVNLSTLLTGLYGIHDTLISGPGCSKLTPSLVNDS